MVINEFMENKKITKIRYNPHKVGGVYDCARHSLESNEIEGGKT